VDYPTATEQVGTIGRRQPFPHRVAAILFEPAAARWCWLKVLGRCGAQPLTQVWKDGSEAVLPSQLCGREQTFCTYCHGPEGDSSGAP
jgi:hypothetical protein